MLEPGDIAYLPVTLQTSAGAAAVYANKAALTGAGWTLTYWNNGAAVASPTWDLVVVSSGIGRYQVALTLDDDAGQGECFLTPPAGYTCSVETFPIDVETYDLDGLAALFLTAQGVPGVQSAADSDLGDVVEGDIWDSGTLTVPESKLDVLGVSDLTGLTLTASAMDIPNGTAVDIDVAVVVAGDRTLHVSWDAFPADMLLDDGQATKQWFIDVRASTTGTGSVGPKTIYRGLVTVVWERFGAGP